MKSLRELYRIGRGPSSSHTMGPESAAKYIKETYEEANNYKVFLFGSLALTGKGHLTDWVIKKVPGEDVTEIKFMPKEEVKHPNTFIIEAYKDDELIKSSSFVSIGGGEISIDDIPQTLKKDVYPFQNFDEIKEYAKEKNLTLDEIVYTFEDKDIKEYLSLVYDTMVNSIKRGLEKEGILPGGLEVKRKAKRIYDTLSDSIDEEKNKRMVSAYAYAVSEENASGGIVATAPTCGASGVLPACLYFIQEKYHISKEIIIDSLAVASLFGNVIKMNASISGAYLGCQAEIGTACSMASSAIAFLKGESIEQIESAAEIAMEHHLGLTCDPIDGLVQIPCIERNAIAALSAIDAAIVSTFPIYPEKMSFDSVVIAMYETGKDLNQNYKETSQGGLARRDVKRS